MGNPWTDLVKETFRLGKQTDVTFSLKDAMIKAKKVYKKGAVSLSSISKRSTRGKTRGGKKRCSKTRGKKRRSSR